MAPRSTICDDGTKPCSKCVRLLPLTAFSTTGKRVGGEPKYNSWCKACIAAKQASYHKRVWGPERLAFVAKKRTDSVRAYLSYLAGKGRRRREFSVSLDALCRLWEVQQGKCALTGWDMTMILGKGRVATNASIDRINSRLGYVSGNIQLVCRAANVAKNDLTSAEFMALCAAVMEKANAEDARVAA